MNIAHTAASRAAAGQTVLIVAQTLNYARVYLEGVFPLKLADVKRRTAGRVDYHGGGAVHAISTHTLHRARGLTIDYLILDDHRPIQDPDFMKHIHVAFAGQPPRISVIG